MLFGHVLLVGTTIERPGAFCWSCELKKQNKKGDKPTSLCFWRSRHTDVDPLFSAGLRDKLLKDTVVHQERRSSTVGISKGLIFSAAYCKENKWLRWGWNGGKERELFQSWKPVGIKSLRGKGWGRKTISNAFSVVVMSVLRGLTGEGSLAVGCGAAFMPRWGEILSLWDSLMMDLTCHNQWFSGFLILIWPQESLG